jgi:hypothetical protein
MKEKTELGVRVIMTLAWATASIIAVVSILTLTALAKHIHSVSVH